MTFDPYNVLHWEWEDEGSLDHCRVVAKEDYDKLLTLYREQTATLARLDETCSIGCLSLPQVRSPENGND